MFSSMFVMAIVMIGAYVAWKLGVLWYVIAVEFLASMLLYDLLNRIIKKRPLIRRYYDLFSYGKTE